MNDTFNLPSQLKKVLQVAHDSHQKIVLVTGVFDLLHEEHRNFLKKAHQAGNTLIVGIESDVRVRKLKGEGRPIWDQERRKEELEQIPEVSGVFILPEIFDQPIHHEQLIKTIRPSVLAVSSHSPHLDRKQRIMDLVGGVVKVVHQLNPDVSTTQILAETK